MTEQQVLDLGRVGVEPADDEHVLDAADDAEVAVGVEHAEVAGVQVAVGVERGRGGVGVVEVAAHHGLAAHAHLARLADGHHRRPSVSTVRTSNPGHGTPTVVAMCAKSSSAALPVTVPASVRP